jgi:hypothetical protein
VLPQRASYFVGRDVNIHNNNINRNSGSSGSTLEMKKGKPNVNPAMRQQYKRAQEMESYRKEMMESQVRREVFFILNNIVDKRSIMKIELYSITYRVNMHYITIN